MSTFISVKNLTKKFSNKIVLNNINLSVLDGEFILILGPNGAGKTTFLKIIETLIKPTSGTISINYGNAESYTCIDKKNMGVISHDSYLYDDLTVEENLLFFSKLYGMTTEQATIRIKELIAQLDLTNRYFDRVKNLSRGTKQRVAIARALIHSPQIILMDEPYTGLDLHAVHNLKILLRESCKNSTIIMVSHEIDAAFELCDRIIIMQRGEIISDMKRKDIASIQQLKSVYEHTITGRI